MKSYKIYGRGISTLQDDIKKIEEKLFLNTLADWYDVPKVHITNVARVRHLFNTYLILPCFQTFL